MKRKNDQPIADVLAQYVGASDKINRGLAAVNIDQVFREEMGEVVAGYLAGIKLNKDTLIISVTSAPLRAELTHSRMKLIDLLNRRLGKELIKKIVVR